MALVIWSFFLLDLIPPFFFTLNNGNKIYILILKGQVVGKDKGKLPNWVPPAAAATIQMSSPLLSIGLIMSVNASGSTLEEISTPDTFQVKVQHLMLWNICYLSYITIYGKQNHFIN